MDYETFVERYADVKSDPWVGSLGVYIVSPKCPTGFPPGGEQCGNRVPKDVKIGKATGRGGFRSRLKSYFTYWPGGLLVHGLLTTPSMDERYFTYKNHATRRETTLKRVLAEKKLTGFGPSNGTEKLGSEWVHAPPAQVMPLLEQIAEPKDKLFGCTQAGCVLVPKRQPRTRANRDLRDLVADKRVVRSKSGEVGDVGVPVVRTRQLSKALRKRTDPIHRRAAAIGNAQNQTVATAVERLDELTQRKVALAGAPNGPQKERNSRELRNATCRLRGRTIKRYLSPSYTHQDVTGDGRCYFYAVLRAIGLPLSGPSGGGGRSNANAALEYFDSNTRQEWKAKLDSATFGDPLNVLQNAAAMRKAMYNDRGIKYVVKIRRSRTNDVQIAEYLRDPIAFVRAQDDASIWSLRPRAIRYIDALSKPGGQAAGAEGQFRTAFQGGNVITFIWRNVRGQGAPHYELIIPSRLLPPSTSPTPPATDTTRRTRAAARVANAKVAKAKRRAARPPAALAEIADTSARARAKPTEAPITSRTRRQKAEEAKVAARARAALSDTALNDSLSRPARRTRGAEQRKANVERKKGLYIEPRRAANSPPPTTSFERQMKRHQPLHRFHANIMTNKGIRHRRLAYDNNKHRVNGRVVSR